MLLHSLSFRYTHDVKDNGKLKIKAIRILEKGKMILAGNRIPQLRKATQCLSKTAITLMCHVEMQRKLKCENNSECDGVLMWLL